MWKLEADFSLSGGKNYQKRGNILQKTEKKKILSNIRKKLTIYRQKNHSTTIFFLFLKIQGCEPNWNTNPKPGKNYFL